MSKIIIIDTSIVPDEIHCRSFKKYDLLDGKDENSSLAYSHGTICAQILDGLTSDYELISIQVLPNIEKSTGKPRGHIEDLKKALELSHHLNADIICMSAVSSILSDSKIIYDVTKQVSEKSFIISALDNQNYITVPTCYPFVVGVRSDRKNRLCPGEVAYSHSKSYYTDIYANCNLKILNDLGFSLSNSFAVPVVAAKLNDFLNRGKNTWEDFVKEISNANAIYEAENNLVFKQKVPIVIAYSLKHDPVYELCQVIMDEMYDRYSVQTSCLCMEEGPYDVRFKKIVSLKTDLTFMQEHYKTDLIFVTVRQDEIINVTRNIPADIVMCVDREASFIYHQNKYIKSDFKDLSAKLYQALT